MQSTYPNQDRLHVALIMDGNGRWATARGLPRAAGHRAGVEAVRAVVEAAPALAIGMLTLYAFSSDNWQRPPREVAALIKLLARRLPPEAARCARNGVRLGIIGRRDRLPAEVCAAIEQAEALTAGGQQLYVRIAIDYSARDALVRAAASLPAHETPGRTALAEALGRAYHDTGPAPDVDLLIRTGGEQRLSDFLLWECAYAELYFTDCYWPDFDGAALEKAVQVFRCRERRFGQLPAAPFVHPSTT